MRIHLRFFTLLSDLRSTYKSIKEGKTGLAGPTSARNRLPMKSRQGGWGRMVSNPDIFRKAARVRLADYWPSSVKSKGFTCKRKNNSPIAPELALPAKLHFRVTAQVRGITTSLSALAAMKKTAVLRQRLLGNTPARQIRTCVRPTPTRF